MRRPRSIVALVTGIAVASMFTGVDPAEARGPIPVGCEIEPKIDTPPLNINFSVTNVCSLPMASMTGKSALYTIRGSLEAQGSPFACTDCITDSSRGTFFPAVPFTEHKLVYDTTIVAPPGAIFYNLPTQCTGGRTPTAVCHVEQFFTVT
jgi:hypothetical protein